MLLTTTKIYQKFAAVKIRWNDIACAVYDTKDNSLCVVYDRTKETVRLFGPIAIDVKHKLEDNDFFISVV
jgi:hypothetical protein